MKKLTIMLAGAVALAGCSTVAISEPGSLKGVNVKGADGKADRTLCIGNEGYWFFNTWPVISSSMEWNREKNGIEPYRISFFNDETALQRLTDVFYKYAERENCDVVDVVVDDATVYPIGVSGIPAWISNLFTTREVYVTGVLKPRSVESGK